MSRFDLLRTSASGWLRSSIVGSVHNTNKTHEHDGEVKRVTEAEIRANEIEAILRVKYPSIRWTVSCELQHRELVSGPLDQYVIVKGLRRDSTTMPPIRIFWRDAASTPASSLVRQITRGLRLEP
jgi:hypothetical protein